MKWIKRISLDSYMLWVHFKTLAKYILDDIKEFIKDFFTFSNRKGGE